MEITVNGTRQNITEEDLNLTRLLEIHQVTAPEMVAVQINGAFVDRKTYGATRLQPQDEVEFLYFMGGGRG